MPLDALTTTAREELQALNEQIAAATIACDEAQRAVDRLEKPAALLAEAAKEYAAEKALHDAAIVVWLENCRPGNRPVPSIAMLELERTIGELRQDVGASDNALEAAKNALDEENRQLSELAARKSSALFRTTVEACREHLQRRALPAMVASLKELAIVESLATELRRFGSGGNPSPEAMSASRRLDELLRQTRQSVAVRGDPHLAGDYLRALAQDPMAEIPAPQNVEVVELPDRSIKPMPSTDEEVAKHINRGPEQAPPEPTFPTSFGQPPGWSFVPPRGAAAPPAEGA